MIGIFKKFKIKNLIKNENGQSLVEFALIIPLILIMLGVVVEGARIIDTKIILDAAASDIAFEIAELPLDSRITGVEVDNDEQIKQMVIESTKDRLNTTNLICDIKSKEEVKKEYEYHPNSRVTKKGVNVYRKKIVELKYNYKMIMPFSGIISIIASSNSSTSMDVIPIKSTFTVLVGVK